MYTLTRAALTRTFHLAMIAAFLSALPNAARAGHWTPPIGIPPPSFGIEESVDDNTFTHWVDNSVSCTDSSNNGTPSNPRCTVPTTLAAGSIVQVRGGAYTGADLTLTLNGTSGHPVFVRGPTSGPRPQFSNQDIAITGSYWIFEHLAILNGGSFSFSSGGVDHAALRHSEVGSHPGTGSLVSFRANTSHVVIYNNEIHHNGTIPSRQDHHCINGGWSSGTPPSNIWVVDNHTHHCSGDSFQTCHGCVNAAGNIGAINVYIGRNEMHDDEENCIDIKEVQGPVIISQNRCYGYRASATSNGDAIRVNDEGEQGDFWIIFNDIWDSTLGVNIHKAASPNIYFIGNEWHDIIDHVILGTPDNGSAAVRVINNTIINSKDAILVGEAKGNIIQATGVAIGSSVVGCSHNHIQAGSIGAFCSNGTSGDPKLVMDGVHVTGLQSDSPAIDMGFADHPAYDTFQRTFGRSIKFDRVGVARPQGAGWDRGAYEFGASNSPPRARTNLVVQ